MNDINSVFGGLNLSPKRGQTIADIASKAGVARGTIYNAARNPQNSTLATLQRIFEAMGYRMVISLEKTDE